ncbi:MAG: ribonuclease HI [Syntrophomonadaceae bacterium]|nr:ribonuclease HI [Syntrophomonadaceae bacterium]MDH7497372.1 ribonuclease HI [Syntrophomonadaceae bacterium]
MTLRGDSLDAKTITIYTDGACSGNPGPGAWAAVLRHGERTREISGTAPCTTNQRMELTAVIEALKALRVSGWDVEVFSDSAYVVNAFRQRWVEKWQRNGWKNARKEPVANRDLWEQLVGLMAKNRVRIHKVEGHAGDPWNERCDRLARQAIRAMQEERG